MAANLAGMKPRIIQSSTVTCKSRSLALHLVTESAVAVARSICAGFCFRALRHARPEDMDKLNKVIDPAVAPKALDLGDRALSKHVPDVSASSPDQAVNVLGKKGPVPISAKQIRVDPSKLDASNKTQLEPLVDWLKHDKQYKEEQKELKKKADAAILHFQNSYKDMAARGIKGAAFDKSSLIEDAEEQRMKELPEPWRLWGSSGLLLVLGVAAAISLGIVCRRARVVAETVPLTDASDLEK
ncbi:Rbm17 [Symbiodinium sp. CCMP2592]|nr:Rbm17 [Symbiodinium sp. CCMP2592]